ncbi:MAG: AMP-binding protein [Clostridia bacterium]|nr:AMP-binding protein [Clostridia bacterium]
MFDMENTLNRAYREFKDNSFVSGKKDGKSYSITYGDFIDKTRSTAKALINKGLSGKRIIIFGENSINYMISDLAVFAFVGVSVNINHQTKKEELCSIISRLNAKAVLYDSKKDDIIQSIRHNFDNICFLCMNDIIPEKSEKADDPPPVKKDENACSKIIFSSGTTHNPKGIMLSLKNMLSGIVPFQKRIKFSENDILYLFIPLHHTYANIYNFLYSFFSGCQIYLCSKTENIAKELLEVNPTVLCGVPMTYKKIYELSKDNLKNAFGNRIRYLFTGGAVLESEIKKAYKQSGLYLLDAYAMTETASSFSIEYPNLDDFESVGTVFENISVKILNPDENGIGSITVKGDNVFLGYAENDELTKASFTDDGYFITGDYGYLSGNKLYLCGRKQNIIIGENGENVYPEEVEKTLKKYSNDIIKLKAFLDNGKVNYRIYLKKDSCIDIDSIISDYNMKSAKKDRIILYTTFDESHLNFKNT